MRRATPLIAGGAALAVLVVVLLVVLGGGGSKKVTAYFPRAVGLYKGSSVRILGVQVGKITSIRSEGTRVRVDMQYDSKYKVPADAAAVIVPPSIVSDRYVQLAPAYKSGPVMASGAVIPEDHTEVPVELDQIFGNMNKLNVALGPKGANKNGALSRLLDVSAANLKGNGQAFHDTLTGLSQAITTLSDNRGDLFGTVSNLQQFTTALARDDGGVRAVNQSLANVSVQLNSERQELATALQNLSIALGQVASFVHDNRAALTKNIKGLGDVTTALVKEKRAIMEVLDDAPLGLENLALAYDPDTQTLRTRDVGGSQRPGQSPTDPSGLVCQLMVALGQSCPSGGSSGAALPGVHPPASVPQSASDSLAQLLGVGQ